MMIFCFGVASFLLPAVICESWSQVMLTRQGLNAADSYNLLYSDAYQRRQCQPFMEDMVSFEPVRSDEINDNQYATNVGVPSYKLDISQFVKSLAAALARQINVADYVLCLFPFYNEQMYIRHQIRIVSIKYVNQAHDLNSQDQTSTGRILTMILTQMAVGQDIIQLYLGNRLLYSQDLVDQLPSSWIINELPALLVNKIQEVKYAVALLRHLKSSRYKVYIATLARTHFQATYYQKEHFAYQLFIDLILPAMPSTLSDLMTIYCKFISIEDDKHKIQTVMELTSSVASLFWQFKVYAPQQQQWQQSQQLAIISSHMYSDDVPEYVRRGFQLLASDQKLSIYNYKFLGDLYSTMPSDKLLATFDPLFGGGAVFDELPFERQVLLVKTMNIPYEWISDEVFTRLSCSERFELLADVYTDFSQYGAMSDITDNFDIRLDLGDYDNSLIELLRKRLSVTNGDGNEHRRNMSRIGRQIRLCLQEEKRESSNTLTSYYCLLLKRIQSLETDLESVPEIPQKRLKRKAMDDEI
ncbi:hypothetical protein MIR68_001008 [Amoeboaphelidium protococcarum]|nr:hypothetical protein MIR68_001008 [Amoeboaphelidium protococcarum]